MGGDDQPISDADPSVVIVGSGPSGLALAIELGQRGVSCLVVERNARVGFAPRAKTTNVRTRTHLRRWGIADKLAAVSPFGVNYPSNVHFVTRLSGPSLTVIENASSCAPERAEAYPEHGQWVPQYKLEQVLREHAQSLPCVTFAFSTEFVLAGQDQNHVAVTIRDLVHGTERLVRARYLVGADGARSAVRTLIGANMSGAYGLSRNYNIVFRAPGLAEAHGHGPGSMYWQVNPLAPSLIGPMDIDDVWFFMPTRLPEGYKITHETAAQLIRQSTGIDLPYEILSSDEWVASSLIADRYSKGRMFLIGDACHLHPPFGGYGMNMGVADGVDLGWKLAATCHGWGGPRLLDSFERERRGIHESVIAEAAANHAVLSNDLWHDGLEDADEAGEAARRAVGDRISAVKTREFHTLGTVLGGCYEESPIILSDGSAAATHDSARYQPTSRPGCLAPHVWRDDGTSLYDGFGPDFTLVCRTDADHDSVVEALSEADAVGLTLTILKLCEGEAEDRYPSRLTLIRPDQHVAWRGERFAPGILRLATGWRVRGLDSAAVHSDAQTNLAMKRDA